MLMLYVVPTYSNLLQRLAFEFPAFFFPTGEYIRARTGSAPSSLSSPSSSLKALVMVGFLITMKQRYA